VDHHTGALVRRWDWTPQFTIAMFIPEQTLNTVDVSFTGQSHLAHEYESMLAELDAAVATRDAARFAAQCTRSAELNEGFVSNPVFRVVAPRVEQLGALGICVGHTGTVCGLLFPAGYADSLATQSGEWSRLAGSSTRLRITSTR